MPNAIFSREDLSVRSVIAAAIFSALSAATAILKLPSPIGSVGLDSFPGFFAAGFISPVVGGIVGFAGHLASAATAGFPSGPYHLLIAVGMFVACFAYGAIIRLVNRTWSVWVSVVTATTINCLIPFACVPFGFPYKTAILVLPFLIIAALANTVIAGVVLLIFAKLRVRGI